MRFRSVCIVISRNKSKRGLLKPNKVMEFNQSRQISQFIQCMLRLLFFDSAARRNNKKVQLSKSK